MNEALDTEYENGVADALSFIVGASGTVSRNVTLPGRRSGSARQIDIVVHGHVFGVSDATVVVECKRHRRRVDVNTAGAFLTTLEDVGADIGILVSASGFSQAAKTLIADARGSSARALTVDELKLWMPPGTVSFDYEVPVGLVSSASRSCRRAGFRVMPSRDLRPELEDEGKVGLSIVQHLGPAGDSDGEAEMRRGAPAALRAAGVHEASPAQ